MKNSVQGLTAVSGRDHGEASMKRGEGPAGGRQDTQQRGGWPARWGARRRRTGECAV